jgi:hypothetical protein
MASRKANITALVDRAKWDLPKVEAAYQKSLHAKAIDPDLRIDIKNLCENLRSALDYLAHDMREKLCPTAKFGQRFYFPILPDQPSFDAKLDDWYPGLRTAHAPLARYLSSVQPFQVGCEWLGTFNKLNNENKHGDLIEQVRSETVETRVTGQGGGQVSWGSGVTFGSGVSIMGVPVDPRTQLPVPHPSIKVERVTWVDFRFDGTTTSALGLLRATVPGIEKICATVWTHI